MLAILCIFLPPVAVLIAGKPFQALLNLLLTACLWLPGVVHAFWVVNQAKAEKRHKELLAAQQQTH